MVGGTRGSVGPWNLPDATGASPKSQRDLCGEWEERHYHTKKPKALKLLAELGAQHGSQEPAPKSDPASICLPERSGSADTRIDQERSLH